MSKIINSIWAYTFSRNSLEAIQENIEIGFGILEFSHIYIWEKIMDDSEYPMLL